MERRRDYGIEALRWLAILAVVMHHGISRQRLSEVTIDQIMILKDWIEWCVPAFFYVSGRLFRGSSTFEFFHSVGSRARRLLVPYFVVSLLSFALLWSVHQTGAWQHSNPEELLILDLIHKLVWLVGFGPQLYFLPYLFVVGTLSGILALIVPPKSLSTLSFIIFLIVGFGWLMPNTVLGPGLERLPAFLLSFCLGVSDKALSLTPSRIHLFGITIGLSLVSFAINDFWPISIAAPLFLYRILSNISMEPFIKRLEKFGNPGAIFLWHAPLVLPACSTILGVMGVMNWSNYLLSVLFSCMASLAIGRIIAKIPGLRSIQL